MELLFAFLEDPREPRRVAAARVLGRLEQPAVSAALISLALRNVQRREALLALLSSAEPQARRFVWQAGQDRSLAGELHAAAAQLRSLAL